MPPIKKDAVDKLVDAVKESAASVEDTPDTKTSMLIDESQDLNSQEFVTSSELDTKFEAFGKSMLTSMSDLFAKQTDVHHDNMTQGPAIPSQELGVDSRGIDPVASNDLIPQAKLEDFMNDVLTIYIHPSPNKEENPVLIPSVNGINQPIVRGQKSSVKRKYVEALARNRHTGYEQIVDPLSPEKYKMIPCMVVKDPFTVQHDPSPRGPEWLNRILCEA